MKLDYKRKVSLEVEAIHDRETYVNMDGRIVGLDKWKFHKAIVIILPDMEYEDNQIKLKENLNEAKKKGISDKSLNQAEGMKKLESIFLSKEAIEASMYHIQCKRCRERTRTLFDVAIGSKRSWVKKPCPKCGDKMEFIKFKVKCPKCGYNTKTFRVSITKQTQKTKEICPNCKVEMVFDEDPLKKVWLGTD